MSSELMLALLIVIVVLVALNLLVGAVLWWRHSGLADRVTRLEVTQQHSLGKEEVHAIYNRLATLESRADTSIQMLQTVHEHLLESH